METTLVLVKPDGVQRGLVGSILARFEAKGLQVVGLKLMRASRDLLEKHYEIHRERPFFGSLLRFMQAGPVVAAALRGEGAIAVVRTLVGATNAAEAAPGTIRGDLGMSRSYNLVHASDGPETATSELALWFGDDMLEYDLDRLAWVQESE
jgi:nucleoside-diphosphate kinase